MKMKGFSLIELVIVMAIVAIMAGVALPAYQKNVQKSARSEAMTELLDIMRAQENYFANRFTYTTDLTLINYAATHETPSGKYAITADLCDGGAAITDCIKLDARAQNGQEEDGDLSLDSRGNKTHNGKNKWLN